jgi:hypothetical protein
VSAGLLVCVCACDHFISIGQCFTKGTILLAVLSSH